MDYVLGSVAALVTGNVTPSRPRTLKRALTPTKHQQSPNVTPKSEFVDDRSIFLSPSMQKKKAIVKKSPKRIFQNPDLETTEDGDGNVLLTSPKADKVKKHLKDDLDSDISLNTSAKEPKTPKIKNSNKKESISEESIYNSNEQHSNENTPKKKKKKSKTVSENIDTSTIVSETAPVEATSVVKSEKLISKSGNDDNEDNKENKKNENDNEKNENNNQNSIKKKNRKRKKSKSQQNKLESKTVSENIDTSTTIVSETGPVVATSEVKSPKKKKQKSKSVNVNNEDNKENNKTENDQNDKSSTDKNDKSSNPETVEGTENVNNANPKKKNKKRKKKSKQQVAETKTDINNEKNKDNNEKNDDNTEKITDNNEKNENNNQNTTKKKNRKRKKSKSQQNKLEATETEQPTLDNEEEESNIPTKKSKVIVNPNAITDKESDSEHESDNEIESENEEINKNVFDSAPVDNESSDEDVEEKLNKEKPQKEKEEKKKGVDKKREINVEDDIKRTLFVGNVPFSPKCKKEIKKIFMKHGQIETIRIRTVPVKDGRYTPKLAVIKNELHPERTTVNVYIKYTDEESVEKALTENNTILNENHLRVSRSSHTGAEHDPKSSIFVGNLPFAMEDEALRQKFENCGEIESVRIIRDKKTNAGKGFGYVNFASKDGVELALQLTEEDLTIKNRIIRVKRCTQSTDRKRQSSDKGGFKKPFNQRPGNQRVQNGPRPNQGGQRGDQGGQRGNQGGQRWNQGGQRWNQGGQRQGTKDEAGRDGAHRRVMLKRKNQDAGSGDGPANKKQKNITQPNKEKKTKKEFVGMTAEKKKKRKFDKGQKKKKALSEILTKQ